MSGFPRARTEGVAAGEVADLDPLTAAVWRQADGAASVEAIAGVLETTREQVWAALDRLYDWGLLEARITPPAAAPVSRRGMLGTVTRGAGWLGLTAAAVAAPAMAEGEHSAEQKNKYGRTAVETREKSAAAQESARKRRDRATEQQEKQGRAPETAREAEHKHAESAREDQRKHLERAREEKSKHGGGPQ